MKKKIIATFAICALFALAMVAFAYQTTNPATADKACCCKSADSCPMKSKGHDDKTAGHEMSCCKKHGEDHAKAGDHASCDCCGDSCPMKKKDGAAASASTDGKSCCDNCDCCKGEAPKATV
jgi:hypothetical protein